MPWRAHLRVREHAPDRELEVRHRVGHDRRAALGDELELRFVHPHAVREHEARREQAEAVEVRSRAARRCGRRNRSPRPRSRGSGGARARRGLPTARRPTRASVRSRCRCRAARAPAAPTARTRRARRGGAPPRRTRPCCATGPAVEQRRSDRRAQPASRTARATAAGRQYMSQKRTVPVRIISRHASRVPQ